MGSSRSAARSGRLPRRLPRRQLILDTVLLLAVHACATHRGTVHPDIAAAARAGNALALSDALEAQIAVGTDTPADRDYAFDAVQHEPDETAADLFARAAITGRYVQLRGLRAASQIKDIEREARRSRDLDPNFRDGAATRMLGTLYVTAPATLLDHGNSEEGLQLLEQLAAQRPDIPENHLRLAEAYITLGDPAPACPHLRRCVAEKSALRPDDQRLLDQLLGLAGPLSCDGQGSAETTQ
jgi:tetratricopeptide repeat protein